MRATDPTDPGGWSAKCYSGYMGTGETRRGATADPQLSGHATRRASVTNGNAAAALDEGGVYYSVSASIPPPSHRDGELKRRLDDPLPQPDEPRTHAIWDADWDADDGGTMTMPPSPTVLLRRPQRRRKTEPSPRRHHCSPQDHGPPDDAAVAYSTASPPKTTSQDGAVSTTAVVEPAPVPAPLFDHGPPAYKVQSLPAPPPHLPPLPPPPLRVCEQGCKTSIEFVRELDGFLCTARRRVWEAESDSRRAY
ncbi:hypothetical protein K438DRAFT_1976250 [Mycena galopus ATCC 62051]|nr:hypothetical protein K438DRAFT_1976250 [Mycena galopus ATCC 62051]